MRDALQELRSGKRFFAAREETKGLWSSARGEAQYTETRALAQGSDPPLASAPYGRPPLMVGRVQLQLRRFSVRFAAQTQPWTVVRDSTRGNLRNC